MAYTVCMLNKNKKMMHRLYRSILFGRFEPIETVVAISAIMHGAWLIFPYWSPGEFIGEGVTGASRLSELFVGGGIALLGLLHLASMAWDGTRVHRHVAFTEFIFWNFLAYLSIIAGGFSQIYWIPYITIMLVSGVIYLNISIGVANE